MGFLNWLLGRRGNEAGVVAAAPVAEGSHVGKLESISIRSENFHGSCARSPDSRFVLAWRDADETGTRGGHRESGPGRYFLMEGSEILARGKMARPNDGKVANNGTFILNDWGFGGGLRGTFFAFGVGGKQLLARTFHANLFNNGLSSDGRFAACQTCNSSDDEDSSVLTIFDLENGQEVARWKPQTGWPHFYEFVPDSTTVGLGYPRLGVFRYTFAGEFLDKPRWEDANLRKGDSTDVLMMSASLIREAGDKPSLELATRIIAAIDRIQTDISDNKWRAVALKLRGLCLEAQDAAELALDCYELALTLDPKVGVKRRVNQLTKLPLGKKAPRPNRRKI